MTFLRGLADCEPIGECELCRTDVHWYVERCSDEVVGVAEEEEEEVVVMEGVHAGADASAGDTVARALPVVERDRNDLTAAVVEGRDIMRVSRIKKWKDRKAGEPRNPGVNVLVGLEMFKPKAVGLRTSLV